MFKNNMNSIKIIKNVIKCTESDSNITKKFFETKPTKFSFFI